MYKILLDQSKLFECDITIEGASATDTQVRLMIESDNFSICFKGEVDKGRVKIPMSKLKNILKENQQGTISLEVIAEDTFFTPWRESYVTETHRKVEVSFNDSKPLVKESKKPTVTVGPLNEEQQHADNIIKALKEAKVSLQQVAKHPKILTEAMGRYCVSKGMNINKDKKKLDNIFGILMEKVLSL